MALSPQNQTKSVYKRINEWVETHFHSDKKNDAKSPSPFMIDPIASPTTKSKKSFPSLRHQLLKTVTDSRDDQDAETDSCGESTDGSRKFIQSPSSSSPSSPTSPFSPGTLDLSQTLSSKFSSIESFVPTPSRLAIILSSKSNLPPSTQTRFRNSRKPRALDSFDHRKSPQFTKLPSPRRSDRVVSEKSSKFIPSVTIASKRQLEQVKADSQKNSAELIKQLSLELSNEENRLSAVAEEGTQSTPESPHFTATLKGSSISSKSTKSAEVASFSSKKNEERFTESFQIQEIFPSTDDTFVYSLQPPEEKDRYITRTLHDRIEAVLGSRVGSSAFLSYTQKRLSKRELVFLQGSYAALLADTDYVKYLAKCITERYMAPKRIFPLLNDMKGQEEAYMFVGFQTVTQFFKELVKLGTMSSLSLFITTAPAEYKQWLVVVKMGDLSCRPKIPRRLSDPVDKKVYIAELGSPPVSHLSIRVITPTSLPVSPMTCVSPSSPSGHSNRRNTIPSATPVRNIIVSQESVPYYTPPPVPSTLDRSKEDDLDRRMREQAYYDEVMGQPKTSIVDKITSAMQNKFLHRLLKSDRWMSSLLQMSESLPVSIMILRASREFPVIYMNPTFCSCFGHDARELIGESYLGVLLQLQNPTLASLQHAHKFGPLVGAALVAAKKFEFLFYTYSNGDKLVPALAAMKPIFDQNGDYKFVLVCMLPLNVVGTSDYTNIVLMDHVFNLFPDNIVTCDAEAEALL